MTNIASSLVVFPDVASIVIAGTDDFERQHANAHAACPPSPQSAVGPDHALGTHDPTCHTYKSMHAVFNRALEELPQFTPTGTLLDSFKLRVFDWSPQS
jgi:hypothetical protein